MKRFRSAFTLIELLVVIAIIAILAVVVVLTLNPAQLLAQSRDANRISDLATINSAINLYNIDQSGSSGYSLGSSTAIYLSLPSASSSCATLGIASSAYPYLCSSSANYRLASSSGWLPVNFNQLSAGAPFGSVPIDPTNQTSTNLYYTYATNGVLYEVTAFPESQKYAKNAFNEGGNDPTLLESGSGMASLPDEGRGLIGYWPLNEGAGTTAFDWAGKGENATVFNSWTAGKTSGSAYNVPSGDATTYPSFASTTFPSSQITVSAWVNIPSFVNFQDILGSNWANDGAWLLYTCSGCGATFGVIHGATFEQAVGCLSAFTTSTWHQIVGTYDGKIVSSYLDGGLCASIPLVGQALTPSGNPLSGGAPAGGPYAVTDLRLYDRALSATEIQQMYNAEK